MGMAIETVERTTLSTSSSFFNGLSWENDDKFHVMGAFVDFTSRYQPLKGIRSFRLRYLSPRIVKKMPSRLTRG